MKRDDTPMWDDPNEPPFVRELLKAGRETQVAYDVERGLAEHLSRIAAAGPAPSSPSWPAESGALVAKVGAKVGSGLPAWVGYVILPLAAAGIAGLAWVWKAPTESGDGQHPARAAVAAVAAPASQPTAEQLPVLAVAEPLAPAVAKPVAAPNESATRSARPTRAASRAGRGDAEPARESATASGVASASRDGAGESQGFAALAPRSDETDETQSDSEAAGELEAARLREPEAEPREPEAAEPREQARAKPSVQTPIIDESQLEREMQMLAVTQRVLASNPARALKLSQQGEREFPGTMFSAERRQLGLLALVKLGRLEEARRIGQPFLEKFPNAPWSERLRRALASGHVD